MSDDEPSDPPRATRADGARTKLVRQVTGRAITLPLGVSARPQALDLQTAELTVEAGASRGQTSRIDTRSLTVGTHPSCDLLIDDRGVSRFHFRIEADEMFLLRDLGSTNGTYAGALRVREAYLNDNVIITIGEETRLRFRLLQEHVSIPLADEEVFGQLRGRSVVMRELFAVLKRASQTDAPILLQGETGTGKELAARAIHQHSRRGQGPFVVFDCSAVPENLIEAHLFGHERGAFTGAVAAREGVFERAHGGTLFLDELGELGFDLQPKLLRVLESREVERIGGRRPIKVDVRIIAATNRDLQQLTAQRAFRQDLYHRLAILRAVLPPLRDRREDIPMLAAHFAQHLAFGSENDEGAQAATSFVEQSFTSLARHDWPGNVRELRNVVERAAICFNQDAPSPQPRELVDQVRELQQAVGLTLNHRTPMRAAREQFEREYLADLLRSCGGEVEQAAEIARIHPKSFERLLRKYSMSPAAARARQTARSRRG
jgi:DNA-binding NtrC family response regulator